MGHRGKSHLDPQMELLPAWHMPGEHRTPAGNTGIHTNAGWCEPWKLPSHSSTSSQHRCISVILCWVGMHSADGSYLSQDTRSFQEAAEPTEPSSALPGSGALYKVCSCTLPQTTQNQNSWLWVLWRWDLQMPKVCGVAEHTSPWAYFMEAKLY